MGLPVAVVCAERLTMHNTTVNPGWDHLAIWLVNHGWPCIDEIDTEDLTYIITTHYAAYQEAWEPRLEL